MREEKAAKQAASMHSFLSAVDCGYVISVWASLLWWTGTGIVSQNNIFLLKVAFCQVYFLTGREMKLKEDPMTKTPSTTKEDVSLDNSDMVALGVYSWTAKKSKKGLFVLPFLSHQNKAKPGRYQGFKVKGEQNTTTYPSV